MRIDSRLVPRVAPHSSPAAYGSLLLALLFVVAGCAGEVIGSPTDPSPDGVDAGDGKEDDDDPPPPPPPGGTETECEDGVDNDGDSLADCDDSDCAQETHCTWPAHLQIDITLDYQANDIAELGGYSDCTTQVTAAVAQVTPKTCTMCDRDYTGPYTYGTDTCPEADRPGEGSYGINFLSETQREVYVLDEFAAWQLVGTANGADGVFTLTRTDPVVYEGYDAGSLTTGMTFTDM